MSDLSIGDVVQLKSGGPRMTVESVDDDWVDCVWFEKNNAHRQSFGAALLTKCGPGAAFGVVPVYR